MQGFCANTPFLSLDCQENVPVGAYPLTVAVHVVVCPTDNVRGMQVTEAVVGNLETVRLVKLGLGEGAALLVSPGYVACMFAVPAPLVVTVIGGHELAV